MFRGFPGRNVLCGVWLVNGFLRIVCRVTQFFVVGHRGWPARFPENTLSGLLAAAHVGDAVEVDIRRSADGKLVLSHDPALGGLTVASSSWDELSELDLGGGHHPALLDEALAALPDTAVQMEVKNFPGEPGFEPDHRLALEAAERCRPGDVVTGFNPETVAMVRRTFANVTTGLCIPPGVDLDTGFEMCTDGGHEVLVPHFSLVSGPSNPDVSVYPWTVNDPEVARNLVEWGATGIITDDPGLIATNRSHT